MSWGLLALGGAFTRNQQVGLIAAAVISIAVALNGWRLIIKHNSILFREEARVIWPASVVVLLAATCFAAAVAHVAMPHGHMDFIVPFVFGGGLLLVLLYRCFHLSNHPKRSDIVRGDSGRRRSRSTASPVPAVSVAGEVVEEEADNDEGPEPPPENSIS